MAVAFDAQRAVATANGATSFSLASGLTVGSGTNRALVVQICWHSTAPTGVSITWNGVALTIIPNTSVANGVGGNVALYGLLNPASGTNTLAASWTGARDYYVAAVAYTGVDQTNIATAFPNGTTVTPSGSLVTTVTITSAVDDAVVAVYATSGSYASVNQTSVFLNNTATNISGAGNRAAGASPNVALTSTLISGDPPKMGAGCNVKASAAATTDRDGAATGAGTASAVGTPISVLTPDADITDGGWLTDTGGTNLFAAIDETPASDTDYIVSSDTDTDTCEIRLSDPSTTLARPFSVAYRYKRIGSDDITLRVALMEGATQRASWDVAVSNDTFTDVEQFLTAPEFASITDFTDLRVQFTAIRPTADALTLEGDFSGDLTLEGDFSGSLLLEGS